MLNKAFIAVHSGENYGQWASGFSLLASNGNGKTETSFGHFDKTFDIVSFLVCSNVILLAGSERLAAWMVRQAICFVICFKILDYVLCFESGRIFIEMEVLFHMTEILLYRPQNLIWTASSEFGTYSLCEQRRFRRACAFAQSRQNLRCSLIQAVSQEEPSDKKPDPWPLWMAGHAQLKFVMTVCSKTQICLTGLN